MNQSRKHHGLRFNMRCMAAIGLIVISTGAAAGDFDGSRPLAGATGRIIEVNPYRTIDHVDPDRIGLPRKFTIDFTSRVLRPSEDSLVRKTIVFKSVVHIENQLVMQGIDEGVEGVEDGLAWSLTLSTKTGKAVLSACGNGVAYVVFGDCTPIKAGATPGRQN